MVDVYATGVPNWHGFPFEAQNNINIMKEGCEQGKVLGDAALSGKIYSDLGYATIGIWHVMKYSQYIWQSWILKVRG